jgi:hypothetical protein
VVLSNMGLFTLIRLFLSSRVAVIIWTDSHNQLAQLSNGAWPRLAAMEYNKIHTDVGVPNGLLDPMATLNLRHSKIVELCYFWHLCWAEVAQSLSLSSKTVKRDRKIGVVVPVHPARSMNETTEEVKRLKQPLDEALDLSPQLRAALLAKVRHEEGAAMYDGLVALLASHSRKTELMSRPISPNVASPDALSAFQEGDLILNRFRIIRLLGRGGMDEVYEAQDSEIGCVALKKIREDKRGYHLLPRVKQEVQLARMVTSPHVCRIHEFFTLLAQDNRPAMAFLTMVFLQGINLADRIKDPGPLRWRDAELIALQLCQGLEAIHSRHHNSPRFQVAQRGFHTFRIQSANTPAQNKAPAYKLRVRYLAPQTV